MFHQAFKQDKTGKTMAWIYQWEHDPAGDVICVDDYTQQKHLSGIWHSFPTQAEIAAPIFSTGEVQVFSSEEIERMIDAQERAPFAEKTRTFQIYHNTPINPANHDLHLTERGLKRLIWTEVPDPIHKSCTHVSHKIAGSGDTQDFYAFAKYFAERLPKITKEITGPRFEEMQQNMRWNAPHKSQSVGKVNWLKEQELIISDFYNWFKAAVEYNAVEPMERLRLKADDARELIRIISPLVKSPHVT